MTTSRRPRVGLALGSGSARGWAHVGVIRALEAAGIRPDIVCGTSVGAMVAAAYAAGELDRFEQWVRGMGITDVVGFMDVTFNGGDLFLQEMQKWMAVNMPAVKTIFRVKRGVYAADDAELWKEIQAANGLMVMAIGH